MKNSLARHKKVADAGGKLISMPQPTPPMPDIAFEAVLSFLKETRGELTWSAKDLADSLKLSLAEALHVLSLLELQGYAKRSTEKSQWMTTMNGDIISNSKRPHYTIARVKAALGKLEERIKQLNADRTATVRVLQALAFGDFLHGRPLAQAADVGIRLTLKETGGENPLPANQEKATLKTLRARDSAIQLRSFQPWMAKRSHQRLV